MRGFGKQSAAAQRQADRREQEDRAPRLADEVPDLVNLRLELEETSTSASVSSPKYVRRIMVSHAPALFLIPCGDPKCADGGHDVTRDIMRALQSHRTGFTGSDDCHGALGSTTCTRVLHFQGVAEYRETT
jgi:hypothetical protein